jgi:putative addiction module antidote
MIQKVLKVGSSAAVTIPKSAMQGLGLKVGDSVTLSIDVEAKKVTFGASNIVDDETVVWARSFMKKYDAVLKELVNK